MVVAPAWDGEVGVLRGHAPMLVLLGTGNLRVTSGGTGSLTPYGDMWYSP